MPDARQQVNSGDVKKCAGGFPGLCDNEAGTPWTPLWCPECDEKRKAAISASLNEMLADLKAKGSGPQNVGVGEGNLTKPRPTGNGSVNEKPLERQTQPTPASQSYEAGAGR